MREGFWYIATPYSGYPEGIDAAYEEACKAGAYLIRHGVKVFVPIAHTHPLAVIGSLDPFDHSLWMAQDEPFVDEAKGLIVVMMESWEQSRGIAEEIRKFREQGKPIIYMEWPSPYEGMYSFAPGVEGLQQGVHPGVPAVW
jgi:hypothetical protein